jgi:predicted Zn-dependent protease
MNEFSQVTIVARQLTEIYPNDPEVWNMLGRALAMEDKLDEAIVAYKHSLDLKPDQPDTQRVMGRLMLDTREFDTAISLLSDLEKRDPNIRTLYPQLAKAQFFKGQYAESALKAYQIDRAIVKKDAVKGVGVYGPATRTALLKDITEKSWQKVRAEGVQSVL